jgi:hypothetical protein
MTPRKPLPLLILAIAMLLEKVEGRGQKAEGRRQEAEGRRFDIILLLQTFFFKPMSYEEQFIWKRAVKLSVACYKLTNYFPKSEIYGLTSQIRRASVSVASNIAEGYGRQYKKEYIRLSRGGVLTPAPLG